MACDFLVWQRYPTGLGLFIRQVSVADSTPVSQGEARRLRRRRKLDQIEIPQCQLTITDELLGKGGFGSVYIADYNGRNVAAKVSYSSAC